MYDYLVVGSGMFGAVFAREMTDAGARCLVVERRDHIAGNCFTENVGGIHVHAYGPHIFHTNDVKIWNYVNRFAEFSRFTYRPKVNYQGAMYSFPINLTTLNQLWGVTTPEQARRRLDTERVRIEHPANLEEWALSQVGRQLYETFIYGYTKKQWGREPRELPTSIIRRIPIRLTWNDDYFDDRFCGIPIGGYTNLFTGLLKDIAVETAADFLIDRERFERIATKIVYTGALDRLFEYEYGANDWRGLRFERETFSTADHQGVAAINHTDALTPYTRSIEHKHFDPVKTDHTVVTREFPANWKIGAEMFYPINNEANENLQQKYVKRLPENYLIGGRLATYRYYDMHQVIASALHLVAKELELTASSLLLSVSQMQSRRRAA